MFDKEAIKEKQAKYKELKKKYKWFFTLKESKQLSEFNEFSTSQDLQSFTDLKSEMQTINFESLKAEIEQQKKDKATELNTLISRHKELKTEYSNYKKAEDFPEKNELIEITERIKSGEHKKAIKAIKFENLDEYKKLKDYEKLKKSSIIKKHLNIEDDSNISSEIKNKLSSFLELENYINTIDFVELKNNIELSKKEKEEEYNNLLSRLQELKKIKEDVKKGIGFSEKAEIFFCHRRHWL